MTERLQPTAQDYIDALERQRNEAANRAANLSAENAALRRHIAALDEAAALAGQRSAGEVVEDAPAR